MNKNFYLGVFFISVLSYLGVTAEAREYSPKKQGRSLASHSPVNARMGQAEQMLHRKSSPAVVNRKSSAAPLNVKIEAACRKANGVYHSSRQPNYYDECLEPVNSSSVSAANSGSSAVGIRVGN